MSRLEGRVFVDTKAMKYAAAVLNSAASRYDVIKATTMVFYHIGSSVDAFATEDKVCTTPS